MQQLASDVGGTFVDLVLFDSTTNRIVVDKVPSTRHSAVGIIGGVQKIAATAGIGIGAIDRFVHGFTIATNAWLTRRGGKVLFLTTAGFRDVLEIGTQRRPKLYALTQTRAAPLVARSRVMEVHERIDAFGGVVEPLTSAEVQRIVDAATADAPDAIAISLLFSYLNRDHEAALAAALRGALPGVGVYPSFEINPQIEEYPRANTTVAAAYVGPAVEAYVGALEAGLDDIGLSSLMLMRSDGGVATPEAMRRNPATMLLSGPAGGVIAAANLGRSIGVSDLVTFDMGGTSADFSLIVGGQPRTSNERTVNDQPLRIPMLDIATISAGGGSIASVDHAGALHVGPQSAGSVPGPACYGQGGTLPTLTDAVVALGIIDPADFAGGSLALLPEAAMQAIEIEVAKPLGLTVDQAALGMVSVACAQIRQAIRALTIERGFDVRPFSLVAFGGAGPIFAALMERDLGMREILIPPRPGVFAALGLLMSDMRHHTQASLTARLNAVDPVVLDREFDALGAELAAALDSDGVAGDRRSFAWSADLRYAGQFHVLTVKLPRMGADWWRADDVAELFHAAHTQVYGHCDRAGAVEIVTIRAAAEGAVDKADFPPLPHRPGGTPLSHGSRSILFPGQGERLDCPVYQRDDLSPGCELAGPAIVSQSDTTVLILPGQTGRVDDWGVIHVAGREAV